MPDAVSVIIPILIFGAVGALVFLLGQYYATQAQTERRLQAAFTEVQGAEPLRGMSAYIAHRFDERRFHLGAERREKLRRKLLKAGYFGAYDVNYYIFARIAVAILLPVAAYATAQVVLVGAPTFVKVSFVAITLFIAVVGPDAYLARRQRLLTHGYKLIFPDLLDLLLVCVDAGLSVETAFTRITSQMLKQNRELGINLEIMGAEIRAGRSLIQALESLTDRLGLDEAASLTTMLRQSIEFGSDVSDALRVFSDEMRDKRLLRAEESANKLSVKMVLPLGLFIFPVVLLVILLPIVIKLMSVLR
jgi:tight adherence protein C